MNTVIIQTVSELKIYFRDKLQVFFGFFFPVIIIVLCASIFSETRVEGAPYIDYIMPGVIAVIIMTTSFFTVGVTIAGYKENLIMKKFRATPMKLGNFLVSVILARLIIILCQVFIMWMIAAIFFKSSFSGNAIAFAYTFIISAVLFLTLGFAIASVTRTYNAAIGIANSFYMGLTFVSAAFYPITAFPRAIRHVIDVFPLIHIVEPIRRVWLDGAWMPFNAIDIIVALLWLILGLVISTLKFKWE